MEDTPEIGAISEVPDWMLQDNKTSSAVALRELTHTMYEASFEGFLEKIANGMILKDVLIEDNRKFPEARYRTWIMKDPDRKRRYYEARAIGAGIVEDEMLRIADAVENPLEDVQRSALRIKTRQWLLQVWDRERYGEKRQVEVTKGPAMDENHLTQLAQRLIKLQRNPNGGYDAPDVIDVE